MKKERDFLIQNLKDAGVHGKVHETLKSLKNCNETHVGAVLRVKENFVRSGSKTKFTDQSGQRKQRNKLFDRETVLHVIIADSDEDKVEVILESFLKNIDKGFGVDGNWVALELGDADWVEEGDSILKSKIAVEFDVTLKGGVYVDSEILTVTVGQVDAEGGTIYE